MMKTFGIDGNLMSLGAIDFGMIVDSAVIIVEAVVTHINQKLRRRASRKPRWMKKFISLLHVSGKVQPSVKS